MRTVWFGISSLALLFVAASADAQATKGTKPSGANSIPKGAVHLLIRSDADARQTFTYFPYPPPVSQGVGIYRLEVNPKGDVAAVTVLKSMGSAMDVTAMKTFVTWRAKPGPRRSVDVGYRTGVRILRGPHM